MDHVHRRSLVAIVVALVVLVVGLAAGCGGDDEVSGPQTRDTSRQDDGDDEPAATSDAIVIDDFAFSSATVSPGATVDVENRDDAPHTVTADDETFDSGNVAAGSSGSVTAPSEPGTYDFHCEIHPAMAGTLTVE